MASKPGLLARIGSSLGRLILRREVVGVDVHGNTYYRLPASVRKSQLPKLPLPEFLINHGGNGIVLLPYPSHLVLAELFRNGQGAIASFNDMPPVRAASHAACRLRASKMEHHEDGVKERRWVKLVDGDYSANQLPPEWEQWLRKSRLKAPTEEDMAQMARERASIKEKAAILEAEDRKRRFQAESLGMTGAQSAGGPDMDRFVQQLTDQVRNQDLEKRQLQAAMYA